MDTIELDQIQGNIFGGFNKDFQAFIFISVTDSEKAKKFLTEKIFGDVRESSSQKVLAFNNQFKALKRAGCPEGVIKASWTNIVFTATGLQALKFSPARFAKLDSAFRAGMKSRASIIGDEVASDPDKWYKKYKSDYDKIHAMILVASDSKDDLKKRVKNYVDASKPDEAGIEILFVQQGRTRIDNPGHEHFGFKDGVSQPGIRGINDPDDAIANPNQGHPGQDLLWPGEFVLGYPTQIPHVRKDAAGNPIDGPNSDEGPNSGVPGEDWMKNCSYLVFRRLRQDVNGFNKFLADTAAQYGLTPDLFGAKLVGRYKSGAPLEKLVFQSKDSTQSPSDPALIHAALAENDGLNNHFEYGEDSNGAIVPHSAHIRKAYPRDQDPDQEAGVKGPFGDDAESRTQTHRLLRRGIPFGVSLGGNAKHDSLGDSEEEDGGPDGQRGLLFLAYQSDLSRQFEFVQMNWVNDADFPKKASGNDPIMSQKDPKKPITIPGCPFHAKGPAAICPLPITRFVTTTGGNYFFSPSIDLLRDLVGAS